MLHLRLLILVSLLASLTSCNSLNEYEEIVLEDVGVYWNNEHVNSNYLYNEKNMSEVPYYDFYFGNLYGYYKKFWKYDYNNLKNVSNIFGGKTLKVDKIYTVVVYSDETKDTLYNKTPLEYFFGDKKANSQAELYYQLNDIDSIIPLADDIMFYSNGNEYYNNIVHDVGTNTGPNSAFLGGFLSKIEVKNDEQVGTTLRLDSNIMFYGVDDINQETYKFGFTTAYGQTVTTTRGQELVDYYAVLMYECSEVLKEL